MDVAKSLFTSQRDHAGYVGKSEHNVSYFLQYVISNTQTCDLFFSFIHFREN